MLKLAHKRNIPSKQWVIEVLFRERLSFNSVKAYEMRKSYLWAKAVYHCFIEVLLQGNGKVIHRFSFLYV